MVGKLIANDLRQSFRGLGTAVGAVFLINLVIGVIIAFRVPFLAGALQIFGIVACLGLIAGFLIYTVVRYYQTMYGRVGYFTMSLPVRAGELYVAKLSYALLVTLAGFVAALVCLVPIGLGAAIADDLPIATTLEAVWDAITDQGAAVIAVVALTLLISVIASIIQYQFVITVGSEARFNHLGLFGPVVCYLLLYLVMQVLMTLGLFGIPLLAHVGDGTISLSTGWAWELLLAARSNNAPQPFFPLGWLPVLLVVAGVLAWWTPRSIRSHTSLR